MNFVESRIVTVIAGACACKVKARRACKTVKGTISFAGCAAFVAWDTAAALVEVVGFALGASIVSLAELAVYIAGHAFVIRLFANKRRRTGANTPGFIGSRFNVFF